MTARKPEHDTDLARRNRRVAAGIGLVFVAMVGLSFASVPLYNLFCRVTGFGGSAYEADAGPREIIDREIIVRFDSTVAPGLPWTFEPEAREVKVKVGQDGFISWRAANNGSEPVTGTALYSITPIKAGRYFKKVQCFCFGKQTLTPGQEVSMPVQFFVDPAIMDDPYLDDVHTITLSYSFFRSKTQELEEAMEAFYNDQADEATN